jgi:hypothetical protein
MTSTSAKFHPDRVAPKISVQNKVFIQVGTLNTAQSEDVLPYTLLEMPIPPHSSLLTGKNMRSTDVRLIHWLYSTAPT